MTGLGNRSAIGKADSNNPLGPGNWTVAFTPDVLSIGLSQYEIYHIAIKGPSASTFQVYQDTTFYDYVNHGDINSWDPSQPMIMIKGVSLYFYWSTNTAPAPLVSIFVRSPTT